MNALNFGNTSITSVSERGFNPEDLPDTLVVTPYLPEANHILQVSCMGVILKLCQNRKSRRNSIMLGRLGEVNYLGRVDTYYY